MRIYVYSAPDGTLIERPFPAGEAPGQIELPNGQVARRDYRAELLGLSTAVRTPERRPTGWPMEPCMASAVHPSQSEELRQHFKKHGLNIEVRDGAPVYESAKQREKALACRGLNDRASYN